MPIELFACLYLLFHIFGLQKYYGLHVKVELLFDDVFLYEDLLLQGEETIKLNAILLNQIRLFLQTKILAKMGYQQANIADTLKVHPYRVKLALQQVRRFELSRLERLYDELVENDYRMKTGQMDKELLFQLFILKLTAQAK